MASLLSSIDWGTKVTTSSIDVYFVPSGAAATYSYRGSIYNFVSDGWNAYETQQAKLALDQIAEVANVTFNYVGSQSSAEFALITDYSSDVNLAGLAGPPGQWFAGFAAFNDNALGWDEGSPGTGGLEQGGEAFKTLLHEFGHLLGLAHPHDTGGSSARMQGVSSAFYDYGAFQLNQGLYTVMSYNSSWQTNPDGLTTTVGSSYGLEGTMMALDIAALQKKYGANMSTAAGDDTYTLPSSNGTGTFYSCIWDAGGTDEIVADASTAATIDLRAATLTYSPGGGGFASYSSGIKGGYTIAKGVVIENATGSNLADVICGNGAANTLDGQDGNDLLKGGGGSDTLRGGSGDDSLRGGGGNDALHLGDGTDVAFGGGGRDDIYLGLLDLGETVNGGRGTDILHFDLDDTDHDLAVRKGKLFVDGAAFGAAIEAIDVQSGGGADVLRGGGKADMIDGGAGNDAIYGGAGNDRIAGGLGDDLLLGQGGADLFDFTDLSGTDTLADFAAADTALFSTADLADFSDFLGACTETGGDTMLSLASGTLIFAGLALDDFASGQFDFI